MQVQPPEPRREPIFNMPGIVTAAVVLLVAIHALRAALLSPGADLELLLDFAVVPARWTAAFDPSRLEAILREAGAGFSPQEAGLREALARYVVGDAAKPWTALTYAVLHGSWAHVLLNAVWLAAFGTPVARRCGAWRFLLLGAACAVAAAAARFVFAPTRDAPPGSRRVGEAHERPRQSIAELLRNRGAAVFLVVWFASNLLFGLAAAPLGITDASVAWE